MCATCNNLYLVFYILGNNQTYQVQTKIHLIMLLKRFVFKIIKDENKIFLSENFTTQPIVKVEWPILSGKIESIIFEFCQLCGFYEPLEEQLYFFLLSQK